MASKRLVNWIVQDSGVKHTVQYTPNQWCAAVHGPAFISTIIVSNTNEDIDEELLQIRLADKGGNTLMLIEPKVPMPRLVSDTFKNDSLVLQEGQSLEFKPTISGIHILVSGAIV